MGVKYAILGLLHYGDMHGYRIKELLVRDFGHMWTVNFGQIYPAMRSMQEEGLVTMARVEQENAPDRKLYSITEKGREEFREWLATEPERAMTLRDPFLLRFTFFNFGDDARSLELIEEQIKTYEEQLSERKSQLPRRSRGTLHAQLLGELGVSLNETMLEWLRHAQSELTAASTAKDMKRAAAGGRAVSKRN